MQKRFKLSALALIIAISACGPLPSTAPQAGRLDGSLFVMWVGEGGSSGDGRFVFVPNPSDRLSFTRRAADGTEFTIRPEMMYTDGGSIPKVAQVFRGFSPWGYAPAYMIHDWLFVARRCITDGSATAEERKMEALTFDESALVLAEVIETLVQTRRVIRNDVAASVISSAVAGPLSRDLWEEKGACKERRVKPNDVLAAEAAIPGSSQRARRNAGVAPAAIVGVISF
jgi:hypothetical protein